MLDYHCGDVPNVGKTVIERLRELTQTLECRAPDATYFVTTEEPVVRRNTYGDACPKCFGGTKQRKVNGKYVLTCVRRCGE